MIELEHAVTPEQQAIVLTRAALRLGISASVYHQVAANLNQLEGNIYQGWLKYANELPPCVAFPIPYDLWRKRAISAFLTPES